VSVRRLPAPPTPLQVWTCATLDLLAEARLVLTRAEYEVLLDIVACRLARDYIARLGVLDAPDESEAA
jgi:hypothetical protein